MWIFLLLLVGGLVYYYGFSQRAKNYGKQINLIDQLNYYFEQAYLNGLVNRNIKASVKPNPYRIPEIDSWAPVLILEISNDSAFTIEEGQGIVSEFLATDEFVRTLHVLNFKAVYCRGTSTKKGYYKVI